MKYVLDTFATAVILVHNHPSGLLTPSEHDINITNTIKNGLTLLNIKVHDHIIISPKSYYSFADEGIL